MEEFVHWLRAQLDEDERITREALRYVDTDWHRDSDDNFVRASGLTAYGKQAVAITADRWRRPMIESPGVTAHIAEWDPSRVLADVDAKRQMVDECARAVDYDCRGMLSMARDFLRHLAASYTGRPGYAEAMAALG